MAQSSTDEDEGERGTGHAGQDWRKRSSVHLILSVQRKAWRDFMQ